MQREIKFRGKRIDNGEWMVGDLRYSENSIAVACDIRHFGIGYDVYSVSPKTVGQFTGVKDKNGREVYEDDIVLQQQYGGGKGKMIVRFEKGAFIVGYHSGSSTRKTPMLLNDRCEVIGNIHDNPELLKTE